MLNITPPTKEITGINCLIPIKNKINGKKQVIAPAIFFSIFKSYQKIFFRVRPNAIKEVKVVIIPKRSAKLTIPSPKKFFKPTKADSVV